MNRLLILGGGGMLGHKLWQTARGVMDTLVTVRSSRDLETRGFPRSEMLTGVDAGNMDSISQAIGETRPDVLVNCVGIVKQLAAARDPISSISINALFPHRLAEICRIAGVRMLHISTDCVFAGRRGAYTESDPSDADDLYGRTKFLGEPEQGALTLRTSIIGRELSGTTGLVEWFLSNRGARVEGFSGAIFSGLTTRALSHVILDVIRDHPKLTGVYHVSVDAINKFDLLHLLNDAYAANAVIIRNDRLRIDRTLDSSRFRSATGFLPASWPAMIADMVADPTPYDSWRTRSDP